MFDSGGAFTQFSANAVPGTNSQQPRGDPPQAPGGVPSGAAPNGHPSESEPGWRPNGGVNNLEEERPNRRSLSGLGSIYASLLSGSSDDLAALADRRTSGTFAPDGSRERETERGPGGIPLGGTTVSSRPGSGLPWVLGGSQGSLVSWLPMFREQGGGLDGVLGGRGTDGSVPVQHSEGERGATAREQGNRPALSRVAEDFTREDAIAGGVLSPTDANAGGDWGVRRRDHHRSRQWRSWGEA